MNRRRMKRTGAFTLIEVLLAVAISSIVLAALYSAFFTTTNAMSGVSDEIIRLHELRTGLDIMRREIEAAYRKSTESIPVEIDDRDFYGKQASSVYFSTSASGFPGPVLVRYRVEEYEKGDERKLRLMKSVRLINQEEREAADAEVFEEIESFMVEGLKSGTWARTWKETSPPEAIRITIAVPAKSGGKLELSFMARIMQGRGI